MLLTTLLAAYAGAGAHATPGSPASRPDGDPVVGRSGSGLLLGELDPVLAPVGKRVDQKVRTSVANIPGRTSRRGFRLSLEAITADRQDFVILNEVGTRDLDTMREHTRGYAAYRDPVRDVTLGGGQSMNNVVMWRHKRWDLVDAGRVKVVDDDRGYRLGEPYTWDRYLTWTLLRRVDTRAQVSVVSLHMPTNPEYFPDQPGRDKPSRKRRWKQGMARVVDVVETLAAHGPVLLGGDMNSHLHQGRWTAAATMGALGYGHARDRGVMHLFHPPGSTVVAHREVEVHSDHAAIVTTVDLTGVGPTRRDH